MATERELTTSYVIMGKALTDAEPYSVKGAFVLLASIVNGLDDAAPSFIHGASHLRMVAALNGNETDDREARRAMVRIVGALEHRLAPASR